VVELTATSTIFVCTAAGVVAFRFTWTAGPMTAPDTSPRMPDRKKTGKKTKFEQFVEKISEKTNGSKKKFSKKTMDRNFFSQKKD
jgi:hypothetical protein